MICKNCNASPDDSVFCPSCGQKVEAEPVAAPAPTFSTAFRRAGSLDGGGLERSAPVVDRRSSAPQENTGLRFSSNFKRSDSTSASTPVDNPLTSAEEPVIDNTCPYCGGRLDPGAKFCNNCGKKLGDSLAKKAEKRFNGVKLPNIPKKGIIAAVSIVAVFAIVLIVGFVTNWFGATGPAAQIASAAKSTFTAKNFSVDFEYTYDEYRMYSSKAKGTAYISFNPKARELTLYADMTIDNEAGIIAIYKGYYLVKRPHSYWGYDISKQLDAYFDAYEEGTAKDFSWEDFIDSIYYKGAYDEAKEDINFDKLDSCLSSYLKNLNSKKWLEENAGYSVENNGGVTMHSFSPNIYRFAKVSIEDFKRAFINRELYDELSDEVADLRSVSRNTNINIAFGIRGKKLVHFEGKLSGSYDSLAYGDTIHIEADFYDIGKTTFDIDKLEEMLAGAKRNGY